jgi:hypothetical protein
MTAAAGREYALPSVWRRSRGERASGFSTGFVKMIKRRARRINPGASATGEA